MYGLEVLHPLVAVVDLPKATRFPARVVLNFGVYALPEANQMRGFMLWKTDLRLSGRNSDKFCAGTGS